MEPMKSYGYAGKVCHCGLSLYNSTPQTPSAVKVEDDVTAALRELVRLKNYKDHFGKDDPYEEAKPVAWENARKALEKTGHEAITAWNTRTPQPAAQEVERQYDDMYAGIAEKHRYAKSEFEDKILEFGLNWEDTFTDPYDGSVEFVGAVPGSKLSPEAIAFLRSEKFERCWVNFIDGSEDYYSLKDDNCTHRKAARETFNETRPGYHDCLDDGEPECHFCRLEAALALHDKGSDGHT
jgi:hypothetical protein